MKFYDEHTIDDAPWPDTADGRKARSFLVPLFRQGARAFFGDRTTLRLLALDDLLIPISINEAEYDNSYFFSIYARYVGNLVAHLKAEAGRPYAGAATVGLLRGLGALLKGASINRVVQVDNWPALRNIASSPTAEQVRRLTSLLVSTYPGHAIVFPALNLATQAPLCNRLNEAGYAFAYVAHTRMLLPHGVELDRRVRENRRRDARLLEAAGYRVVDGRDLPGCAPRLAELYVMLNREKYATNPPVSAAFFEAALRGDMVQFRLGVKDGRVDLFYGFHVQNDVLYSPVAGYDLRLPRELGLYRALNSLLMHEAFERGVAIETGGGADRFKSLRGDAPLPRYNATQYAHLPPHRRAAWHAVEHLANRHLLSAVRAYLRESDPDALASFEGIPDTFAPPSPSPAESAAGFRRALEALQGEFDEAAKLPPHELAARLPGLAQRLDDWPSPSRRLDPLWASLERLERRRHEGQHAEERSKRASLRARRAHLVRELLESAAPLGDALLVAAHLGEEPPQQVRALAEGLRKASGRAVAVLTATQGDALLLVTAVGPAVLGRGVDAVGLLREASPTLGAAGRGEGSSELAWAEGTNAEGAGAVAEAARRYLEGRLVGEGPAPAVPEGARPPGFG
jgi:GNAT acetyltransferase-like protein